MSIDFNVKTWYSNITDVESKGFFEGFFCRLDQNLQSHNAKLLRCDIIHHSQNSPGADEKTAPIQALARSKFGKS